MDNSKPSLLKYLDKMNNEYENLREKYLRTCSDRSSLIVQLQDAESLLDEYQEEIDDQRQRIAQLEKLLEERIEELSDWKE